MHFEYEHHEDREWPHIVRGIFLANEGRALLEAMVSNGYIENLQIDVDYIWASATSIAFRKHGDSAMFLMYS